MNTGLLVDILRCPHCGRDLVGSDGTLICSETHSFPYRDNVVDFSSVDQIDPLQQRSQKSFGIEWSQYYAALGWSRDEIAAETEMFLTYTRAMPNFFSNRIVVDAGCGNGRYINILNQIAIPPPELIIGIDLSESIFVAAKNCAKYANVIFIKMNLNLLDRILKKPVDYVYSIGVLHHTPDAKGAFDHLANCLKPDGFLSVYLYGKGNPLLYRVNSYLRNQFFQNWPPKLVYYLMVFIAIPGQIFRLKFIGPWLCDFFNRFVFISYDVHNMFDAYTAGYTSFHSKAEVEGWYRSNRLDCVVESQQNHTALFCIGRKTGQ